MDGLDIADSGEMPTQEQKRALKEDTPIIIVSESDTPLKKVKRRNWTEYYVIHRLFYSVIITNSMNINFSLRPQKTTRFLHITMKTWLNPT